MTGATSTKGVDKQAVLHRIASARKVSLKVARHIYACMPSSRKRELTERQRMRREKLALLTALNNEPKEKTMTIDPNDLQPLPTSHWPASESQRFPPSGGPRKTDLTMPVRLYRSALQLADGAPEWTGTLQDFWIDNVGYELFSIGTLANQLNSGATIAFGGGTDTPDFWLMRGAADAPKVPDGWAVADTSVEDETTIGDLVAALEAMLTHYDMSGVRDWTPNKATIIARAALARAKCTDGRR